jgi:hypothetical protein
LTLYFPESFDVDDEATTTYKFIKVLIIHQRLCVICDISIESDDANFQDVTSKVFTDIMIAVLDI